MHIFRATEYPTPAAVGGSNRVLVPAGNFIPELSVGPIEGRPRGGDLAIVAPA